MILIRIGVHRLDISASINKILQVYFLIRNVASMEFQFKIVLEKQD